METSLVIALIGLAGGVITALTSIAINRLNRKDKVADENTFTTKEIMDFIVPVKEMCVASVRDKLRHYAYKYLADPEKASVTAVNDWLDLESWYEKCGGNSHIKAMRPKMEELLERLSINEQK